MTRFIRRFLIRKAAREFGKLGGQARARQQQARYSAKARLMREQCGFAPDPRLGG